MFISCLCSVREYRELSVGLYNTNLGMVSQVRVNSWNSRDQHIIAYCLICNIKSKVPPSKYYIYIKSLTTIQVHTTTSRVNKSKRSHKRVRNPVVPIFLVSRWDRSTDAAPSNPIIVSHACIPSVHTIVFYFPGKPCNKWINLYIKVAGKAFVYHCSINSYN